MSELGGGGLDWEAMTETQLQWLAAAAIPNSDFPAQSEPRGVGRLGVWTGRRGGGWGGEGARSRQTRDPIWEARGPGWEQGVGLRFTVAMGSCWHR